jgi:DNA-binding NarL/FixJ family response regulator
MKVLLIDDHALLRDALCLLIERQWPELTLLQAGTLAEAMAVLQAHADVSLALLDLGLPDSEGVGGVVRLREAAPFTTVIVLSADPSRDTVLAAIDAGAAGFVPKTAQGSALVHALRQVLDGGVYVPQTAHLAPQDAQPDAAALDLSPRQMEVLRLLIEGKSNKLICRELDLSESTVKTHLLAIFRRLGVNSRTQAVLVAAQLGLRLPHRANPGGASTPQEPAAARRSSIASP